MSRISDFPTRSGIPTSGTYVPIEISGVNYKYDIAGFSQVVTPQQFQASSGLSLALGGGVQNDSPAFVAAIVYLKTLANADNQIYYKGSPKLFVPAGMYNMGTTTLDISHTLIIEGESGLNGLGSRLRWSGDATGIRIQAYNTTGASSTTAPGFNAGTYTVIRNLGLTGPYKDATDFTGKTEGEFHGIHARSNYVIENCYIEGFAGDGLHVLTSSGAGGAEEGNSNCSFVNRLQVKCVRNGAFIDGADGNASTFIGIIGTYCRQHTVWDSSFLGNAHIGHHSANAGLVPGVPPCVVTQGGNRYGVIQGQATWCSTNAPTGTTADNQGWLYMGAGGASPTLNILAWLSGTTYREGGGYRTDSANAANVFINPYQEGGECPSQFVNPTLVIGGLTGGARDLVSTGNIMLGGKIIAPSPTGGNKLGATNVYSTSNTLPQLIVHNSAANAAGAFARSDYCQGYEADGVTPMGVARIQVWPSTNSPATAEGVMYFGFRTFGGAGAFTDLLEINGSTGSTPHLAPLTDNAVDSGRSSVRWKNVFAYTVNATTGITTAGTLSVTGAAALNGGMTSTTGAFSTSVTIGSGTALTKAVVYTPTLTPASVSAATVAEQTFTVTGLTTADKVIVNPPAIANATGIAGARVSAADTLAIRFVNPTAGALTPTAGTYTVLAFRS